MPNFLVYCEQCGSSFEKFVSIWDKNTRLECPSCGSHSLRKQMTLFSSQWFQSGSKSEGGCGPERESFV